MFCGWWQSLASFRQAKVQKLAVSQDQTNYMRGIYHHATIGFQSMF
jgi:hypothetical protein